MKSDYENIRELHRQMLKRCYNPKSVMYRDYGAKGITVCEEWHDRQTFREWALSHGYEKGLRLTRKDSSKGYSPDNCFFSTNYKAKHGQNESVRTRAKANKARKQALGLNRLIDSPLYKTYISMHTRCEDPSRKCFKHYGGRGITVCPEWSGKEGIYNFLEWAKQSGWRPGLTLDRRDNNKGYSPENCHWATQGEQIRNRRNTIFYVHRGANLTLKEIAQLENVNEGRLRYRIREKNMTIDEALISIRKAKNHATRV